MTWTRLAFALLLLWLLALSVLVQPIEHHPPLITHVQPLDAPDGDLPTLETRKP